MMRDTRIVKPLAPDASRGELRVALGLNAFSAFFYGKQDNPGGAVALNFRKALLNILGKANFDHPKSGRMDVIDAHAALSRTNFTRPSAVTTLSAAAIIASIVSRVMFWPPRRMRETDASLIGGRHFAPNSAAVGDPGRLRN